MYSLDINFLNDRAERPSEAGLGRSGGVGVAADPRPYYIGAALAIALPALVAGFWLFLQSQNRALEQRQAELDSQLGALQAQLGEVNSINSQIQAIESENRALASVFDYIKPWSAILQDVRSRVPSGVQIGAIEQIDLDEAAAPPPSPSPSPSPSPAEGEASPPPVVEAPPAPPPSIAISGVARSFNDVNDFVLTLQRSPFLKGDEIKLVNSQLVDNPTTVEFANQGGGQDLEVRLPQVVEYRIEGTLTNLPASELLQDLERTLSVGLASRIQALRDRGVLER
ncbi:MAG: PilN domain-containing protein [Elainella sp. Prado103]|nr:PilN domain-containing protein [Elainella sp. Prado103]